MRPDACHSERPLSPEVLEEAANWLLRLNEHDAKDADFAACAQWRHAAPEHARAWAKAEQVQALLALVPATLAHPVLDRSLRINRRAALKQLGAALLLVPGGWLSWQLWDQAGWDDNLHTAVGERRTQPLPDGSLLHLDTDTRLDIAFGTRLRLLRLRQGRILITTAVDPQQPPRPLRVVTAHGSLQALGTRFSVRADPDRSWLTVLQGAVRVEPVARSHYARRIEAGHSISFDRRGFGQLQRADASSTTWSHGMLAADALPLQQLLAELSRYRRGVLRCSPELSTLPVSGAFPLDETERSLAMLAATYPLRVVPRAGGWWTTLVPRHD
jgi:transmembrane sensor